MQYERQNLLKIDNHIKLKFSHFFFEVRKTKIKIIRKKMCFYTIASKLSVNNDNQIVNKYNVPQLFSVIPTTFSSNIMFVTYLICTLQLNILDESVIEV